MQTDSKSSQNDPSQAQAAAKAVCIVEDDKLLSLIYSKLLAKEGFRVEVCASGAQAWDALNRNAFDLVLLDLVLPDMNGLSLLEKIRSDRRFANISCMIITNSPLSEVIQAAHSAGVEHVFPKAKIKAHQVVGTIKTLLESKPLLSISPSDRQTHVGSDKDISWFL